MITSTIQVTGAAADLSLLTIEELREAADAADRTEDAMLRRLGARVAARITAHCKVRGDGTNPPTLRQETVTQVIYLKPQHWHSTFILFRRPVVSVTAFAIDEITQDLDRLVINAAAGIVAFPAFRARCVEVVYVAGFAKVPDDLKLAAVTLCRKYLAAADHEPGLRHLVIPNIIERQFWVGQPGDPDITADIAEMLSPYLNAEESL